MKVLINTCFGGAGFSDEAFELLLRKKGIEFEKVNTGRTLGFDRISYYKKGHANDNKHYLSDYDYFDNRADPDLIAVFEELGEKANSFAASLKIVEIPDDIEWEIQEYDGRECVAEKHRTWS